MGLQDNRSEQAAAEDSQSAEQILRTVTQDLRVLQQNLVTQLGQDIHRLQAEKSRLLNDIERLQDQREMLQSEQQDLLSQQQLAQQQAWARQLAKAIAAHLHAQLAQRLDQTANLPAAQSGIGLPPISSDNGQNEGAYRLLSSLDKTLDQTLESLRRDLKSYQSSLSQQINRMQTLEQQGEAILEALVNRLSQQLQQEVAQHRPEGPIAPGNGFRREMGDSTQYHPSITSAIPPTSTHSMRQVPHRLIPTAPTIAPEPVAPVRTALRPPIPPKGLSQFQLGFVLILLSTVALSLHNVVVKIIGRSSRVMDWFEWGGYINLSSFDNSLLILFIRMAIVAPGMLLLAGFLYPPVWRDVKTFFRSRDWASLRTVVGSGLFLFLSQVLIYIAFGEFNNPGIPVTILFMYPLITVPLAWVLFGDRPSLLRTGVMFAIFSGVILATVSPNANSGIESSWLGIGTAVSSGLFFALYLISMQISFRKLHPVPVSVIQFLTIFFLSGTCLLWPPLHPQVSGDAGNFLVGTLVLGTLTLAGYLLNNFGVRFMGAAQASIVASAGPALTAFLAFLIIGAELKPIQWLGILIVVAGVGALSIEKLLMQKRIVKAIK
jgi:drug/metabolite transporter (DMT)-like permease